MDIRLVGLFLVFGFGIGVCLGHGSCVIYKGYKENSEDEEEVKIEGKRIFFKGKNAKGKVLKGGKKGKQVVLGETRRYLESSERASEEEEKQKDGKVKGDRNKRFSFTGTLGPKGQQVIVKPRS